MDPKCLRELCRDYRLELSIETVDVLRSALNVRKKDYPRVGIQSFPRFLLLSSVVQSSLVCHVFNFRSKPSE